MKNIKNILMLATIFVTKNVLAAGSSSDFSIIKNEHSKDESLNESLSIEVPNSRNLSITIVPLKNNRSHSSVHSSSSRRSLSGLPSGVASISPILGGSAYFFNMDIEDSIVEHVATHTSHDIIPRSEIRNIVAAQLRNESSRVQEQAFCDIECIAQDASIPEVQSNEVAIKHATKQELIEEITKIVESVKEQVKEQIIAAVISYELPTSAKTLSSNLSHVNFDLDTRLDNLNTSISGLASGDTISKHGVWWLVSKSSSRQKETSSVDAFRSQGNRFTLGYDLLTERDNTYGIAYSLLFNDLKFKIGSSSERIKHHNYTVYSSHALTDKLHIPLSFNFGNATIKTNRDLLWKSETVTGNTKAKTFGAKVGLTYNLDIAKCKAILTPHAHLLYEGILVDEFVENGTKISKIKSEVTSSSIGASLSKEFDFKHSTLIPVLQYSYTSKLKGKAKDVRLVSTVNHELLAVNSHKLSKSNHTLISSVTIARSGVYSYSLGHQYTKSQDEYTSHTGYLKIKINL